MQDYKLGFTSLNSELMQQPLAMSGKLPSWLSGSLIRNGPAKFVTAQQSMQHWFDGFAMLHKFEFITGKILYSNKFLLSNAYLSAQKNGKVNYAEFATNANLSFAKRLKYLFSSPLTDNTKSI